MYSKIRSLISPEEIKRALPVPSEVCLARDRTINDILAVLDGRDRRKLFIVGPCSADDPAAVVEFSERLAPAAQKVSEKLVVIVRAHTAKPRTHSDSYLGLIHTPEPDVCDINAGLIAARRLHIDVARRSGLFTCDELLYPQATECFDDIICYATVGARSSEDQYHRFAASALDVPIGIKNPPSGNIDDLLAGVGFVQSPHDFIYRGAHVRSSGNVYAHAVLRGATDADGNYLPNYGKEYIMRLICSHARMSLKTPSVIIDCAHANSGKDERNVPRVLDDVLDLCASDGECDRAIKGFCAEGYLLGGKGEYGRAAYGMSVTDGCLSLEQTVALLYRAAERAV